MEANAENARQRERVARGERVLQESINEVRRIEANVAALREQLNAAMDALTRARADEAAVAKKLEELKAEVSLLADVDLGPIKKRIEEAESLNRKVRANQQKAKLVESFSEARNRYKLLDRQIDAIENPPPPRRGRLAAAGSIFLSDTKVAAHFKASYFKVKNWRELYASLGKEKMLEVNKAFLRQQVSQGKQIILSHDPTKATGFFREEVEYLKDLGYQFVREGWFWKAVK